LAAKVPAQNLAPEESKIFEAEFPRLTAAFTSERRVIEIFEHNKAFIVEGARIAKDQFKEAFFGINASSGFGWQLLRPEHLLRTTSDSGVTNTEWIQTVGTAGWTDWIGTSTTMNQINDSALIVMLAQLNYAPSPKSYAVVHRLRNVIYPVWYFEWAIRMREALKVWEFPEPIILKPKAHIYSQLKYSATGEDIPAILGVTFAKADYLQTQTPTLESP